MGELIDKLILSVDWSLTLLTLVGVSITLWFLMHD